ncbi:MAG: hypothetical protein LC772_10550, partial [Chloroflexi bacterium]|nr:hypothetical protein [Chloroflexota bacterium]
VGQAGSAVQPAFALKSRRPKLLLPVAALLLVAIAAAAAYLALNQPKPMVLRAELAPPAGLTMDILGDFAAPPALSPDGTMIVFGAHEANGSQELWLRRLDNLTAQKIEGAQGGEFPFWSPDSKYIAFFQAGKLKTVPVGGGPVKTIADGYNSRGGTWSQNGEILYSPSYQTELFKVSVEGGKPERVTTLDPSKHTTHRFPWFLPDGEHFIYLAANHAGANLEDTGIYFASLKGGTPKLIVNSDSAAQFANGRLIYVTPEHGIVAQRFNTRTGTLSGDAAVLAGNVHVDDSIWRALFTVSQNGVLGYNVGNATEAVSLVMLDRTGKQLAEVATAAEYLSPTLSPDGTKVAYIKGNPKRDLWVQGLHSKNAIKLTFDNVNHFGPSWTNDSKDVVYMTGGLASDTTGGIFEVKVDGSGSPRQIAPVQQLLGLAPQLTVDGGTLIYVRPGPPSQIIARRLSDGNEKVLVSSPNAGGTGLGPFRLSPDNRYLAYTSAETGRPEIFVVPFNGGDGKWQVSFNNGTTPRWRADGRELFYNSLQDSALYAVELDTSGPFSVRGMTKLFTLTGNVSNQVFDVSKDGNQFITNSPSPHTNIPLVLSVNWDSGLK